MSRIYGLGSEERAGLPIFFNQRIDTDMEGLYDGLNNVGFVVLCILCLELLMPVLCSSWRDYADGGDE